MKKLISIAICSLIFLTGCSKEKNYIFFSSKPILEKTFSFDQVEKTFQKGQTINFIVVKNTEFKSKKLRVQIIKQNDKVEVLGYEMIYGNDYETDLASQFFIDSICLHSQGFYIFRVFDFEELKKPYAESYFWIAQ